VKRLQKLCAATQQENNEQHRNRDAEQPKQNVASRTRLLYFIPQMHFCPLFPKIAREQEGARLFEKRIA
jgi:hypothetical protein